MMAWLRRWLGWTPIDSMLVVCVKGVPKGVFASSADAKAMADGLPRSEVRIYRVPFGELERL